MTTNRNDPLVELWAERNTLLAKCNAADAELDAELEVFSLSDKLSAIESRIAKAEAKTLAGVLVQVKLHDDILGHGTWIHSAEISRNIITALERMEGAS